MQLRRADRALRVVFSFFILTLTLGVRAQSRSSTYITKTANYTLTVVDPTFSTSPANAPSGLKISIDDPEGSTPNSILFEAPDFSLAILATNLQPLKAGNTVVANAVFSFTPGCVISGPVTINKLTMNCRTDEVGGTGDHILTADITIKGLEASCAPDVKALGSFIFTDGGGFDCATTPGDGGGGGGTGGDGGGTPTPPPTPPDIQIGTMDGSSPQLAVLNGESATLPLHFYSLTGFSSDLALSATSDSPENNDFHVSVTPDSIASPGEGNATLKIDVGPMALPRDYIVTVAATTNEATPRTFFSTYLVTLNCDPPMILGLDQPRSQSVTRGSTATLNVKPTGSGPFVYQWYNGYPGLTWSPVSGATNRTFTTPAVTDTNSYWVRITNACGSTDSGPATVSPK